MVTRGLYGLLCCLNCSSYSRAGCNVIEPDTSLAHESLLRRPAHEDPRSRGQRDAKGRVAAKTFGVSRSCVKRYAAARREGRPLAPKKHPGFKAKLDERARKLLEADVEERPAATLKDRCRFLKRLV